MQERQNLFHFSSILRNLKHLKNSKEIKTFTSSGNSSLTKDIISDVFPTLAVKRKINTLKECSGSWAHNSATTKKVYYLLANIRGIQIITF